MNRYFQIGLALLLIAISGCHFAQRENGIEAKSAQLSSLHFHYSETFSRLDDQLLSQEGKLKTPQDSLPAQTYTALLKDSAMMADLEKVNASIRQCYQRLSVEQAKIHQLFLESRSWLQLPQSRSISRLEHERTWEVKFKILKEQDQSLSSISDQIRKTDRKVETWVQDALAFQPPRPVYYYPVYVPPAINP